MLDQQMTYAAYVHTSICSQFKNKMLLKYLVEYEKQKIHWFMKSWLDYISQCDE